MLNCWSPFVCLLVVTSFFGLATTSYAASEAPRFASLRHDKVYLRVGPGKQYPIAWVYQRQNLPVKILARFDLWRKVRDPIGDEGWIHKSLLSNKRFAIITKKTRTLFRTAGGSVPVIRAEPGVQGQIITCTEQHCRLRVHETDGWVDRAHLWGLYADEILD